MRGRQIKVEILLTAILVLIVAGASGMLIRPAQKPDQVLKARFGDVIWNHDLHARMPDIANCTVCHHTERQGVTNPKPCGECHTIFSNEEAVIMADLWVEKEERTYSGEQGPPAMEVFHGKCVGCHKAMKQGPALCRDCHGQTYSGSQGMVTWDHRHHARKMDVECVKCHHKDTEAKWDGDHRGCRECHKPARILGLEVATGIEKHEGKKHGQCHTCHTVANPERDRRTCIDCHPGLYRGEKEGEEIAPSIDTAIHVRCGECHNLFSPEYEAPMPVLCRECHAPDSSMLFRGGSPPVIWSHKRHGEYTEWECSTCHHTDVPGEPHMACRSCHGAAHLKGIPEPAEALDRNCIGCHVEQKAGLARWKSLESERADLTFFTHEFIDGSSFWWDHRFHAVSLALSCRECHHNTMRKNGSLLTPYLSNPDVPEEAGDFQKCENCHGVLGPRRGSPAQGSEAPSFTEAFKKVCIECHVRLGGGPLTWEALCERQAFVEEGGK